MKISVVVGGPRRTDDEFECPIEEASFYDVTSSRPIGDHRGPPEIPSSVFAAAPELLEACKNLLRKCLLSYLLSTTFGKVETATIPSFIEQAKEAIAKAEGKSS